jgi:two-component system response regulator MprA
MPAVAQQTVLIVEDDQELRRLYRSMLVFAGFAVREAGDGLDALRWIDSDPPDLVLLDLSLPFISGQTVRQEIAAHAQTRSIPIVVVTGSTAPLDDLQVDCVLRKPVSADRLIEVVHRCLASGARPAGA